MKADKAKRNFEQFLYSRESFLSLSLSLKQFKVYSNSISKK